MNNFWKYLIDGLLKYKLRVCIWLILCTLGISYFTVNVKLDYSYTKSLPLTDSFYIEFQQQKKLFGADANVMFVGFKWDNEFTLPFFRNLVQLHKDLAQTDGVINVWSLKNIVRLSRLDTPYKHFQTELFIDANNPNLTQQALDKGVQAYLGQPLFKNLFFNPYSHYVSLILTIDPLVMESSSRTYTMDRIKEWVAKFDKNNPSVESFLSGMPFLRVEMARNIKQEMIMLILASAVVSLLILFWCFRSFYTLLIALAIMIVGIIWCFGLMNLFGFNITILNSLTPTLVVIIGIPNCIYILNAYRTKYMQIKNKQKSIYYAIHTMGLITFLCNLIAAIGFYAFAFTDSPLLVEFGLVAGTSVLALFPIALIIVLNYIALAPPPRIYLSYRQNVIEVFTKSIRSVCYLYINKPIKTLIVAFCILLITSLGIKYLKSNSFVFDGIPQKSKLYKDLRFFERELKGVSNIDLIITSKTPITRDFKLLERINDLCTYVKAKEHTSDFCLSLTDGLKMLRQSFYNNAPAQYAFPSKIDYAFLAPYIRNTLKRNAANEEVAVDKNIIQQFITKNQKICKLSFFVENIGSNEMQLWRDDVKRAADSILGKKTSTVITGSGIAFTKGNEYVMDGLIDSVLLSLLLISICIFLVYRSFHYVWISIIPNLIPLLMMLGILGWLDIALSPSTVIIFGIAFGVANDLTLRIMISYAKEGKQKKWIQTFISSTPSVIFTSLVLIFGFSVFCISDMKNIVYIGFLMSLAMFFAALSNLIILPVLLKLHEKKRR